MTKPCETCPETLLLGHAVESRRNTEHSRDFNVTALGRCSLRDLLAGRAANIQDAIDHCDQLINYYDQILPEGGTTTVENCSGPFERYTPADDEAGGVWRDRVCGARMTDQVTSSYRLDDASEML